MLACAVCLVRVIARGLAKTRSLMSALCTLLKCCSCQFKIDARQVDFSLKSLVSPFTYHLMHVVRFESGQKYTGVM